MPIPFTDPQPLMRQLAAMANMEMSNIRRMVLVLDVNDAPMLYTEGFLDEQRVSELVPTQLEVVPDVRVTVNDRAEVTVTGLLVHVAKLAVYWDRHGMECKRYVPLCGQVEEFPAFAKEGHVTCPKCKELMRS